MATSLDLPGHGRVTLPDPPGWPRRGQPPVSRHAYAAAHVVARPAADGGSEISWDETLAVRHRLWALGLGVADAMDTAQRGAGMPWPATVELIRRSAAEAAATGGALVCGAGTDHLDPAAVSGLPDVLAAYREQLAVVEDSGAGVVLMASRALAATARHADDYLSVYGTLLREVRQPVILHWLGSMFDPALTGYWGSTDSDEAAGTVLALVRAHPDRVAGIKVSLLDVVREESLRRELPAGVRLYTGDDFHYPELILGDGDRHSDALLGIFDGIAAPAAYALRCLDAGDTDGYLAAMRPTVPLARHIFAAPTYHYKTGLAFLAWLNGYQEHFRMVGGAHTARDPAHLAALLVLAARAGVLVDPELAAGRMTRFLETAGGSTSVRGTDGTHRAGAS